MLPSLLTPKSLWSYNPLPTGCVLYLPLWSPGLNGSVFKSADPLGHKCSVTGTTHESYGRLLDGSDDKIIVTDHAALQLTDNFTIIMWFYLTAFVGNDRLLSKDDGADYQIRLNDANDRVDVFLNAGGQLSSTNSSIVASTKYMLSVTYDKALGSNNIKIFINDSLNAQGAYSTSINQSSNNLCVGGRASDDAANIAGRLHEVGIWNKTYPAEAITYVYNNSVGRRF